MAPSTKTASVEDYPLHKIAQKLQAGLFLIQQNRFLYANSKCAEIFGYSRTDLMNLPSFFDLVAEMDQKLVGEKLSKGLSSDGSGSRFSFRGVKMDGQLIDLEVYAALTEVSGRAVLFGTLLDITVIKSARAQSHDVSSRNEAEAAGHRLESEYQQLIESVQAIVWRCDARTFQFNFINDQAEALLGYPAARWIGEPVFWEKCVFPDDRDLVISTCRKVATALKPHEIECRLIAANGRIVWLRGIIHPIAHNYQVMELLGIMMDITARKSAELAVDESKARLESVINSAMDAIITIDANQKILIFNHAAEKVFGCTTENAKGLPIERFIPEKFRVNHRQHIVNFGRTGGTSRAMNALGTITGLRANGEEFPVEASISQAEVSGDKLYTVILRDITERRDAEEVLRRTEQQLLQSHKMEAIGRLAGGVAHDFNNLLTGIIGFTEVLMSGIKRDDPFYDSLGQIHKAGERAAELTKQLLAFSRQQILQPEVLDLNDIINESARLLRRLIGEDIELTTHLQPDLGNIRADRGQMGQVIMNLVVNARDAMPKGGKLFIETSNVLLDESYVSEHLSSRLGPHVMLAVSDNGLGMSAETKAHIFEPFFTTKERGKGTGLGLSTVYGVVQQSGGYIWVYSEPGEGTTFKVYFPRVDVSANTVRSTVGSEENPRGSETILLVEDEEIVRRLACHALETVGYRVLEAANGEEATALSEKERDRIDLLLTDIVMPGIRGDDLAARLRRQHPGVAVLYMSGHTENAIMQTGTLDANFNLLPKPFTPGTLTRRVRKILDSRRRVS